MSEKKTSKTLYLSIENSLYEKLKTLSKNNKRSISSQISFILSEMFKKGAK